MASLGRPTIIAEKMMGVYSPRMHSHNHAIFRQLTLTVCVSTRHLCSYYGSVASISINGDSTADSADRSTTMQMSTLLGRVTLKGCGRLDYGTPMFNARRKMESPVCDSKFYPSQSIRPGKGPQNDAAMQYMVHLIDRVGGL
jgi:hypothetical protein